MDAHGNFWGAATGPGNDPADAVCNDGASQAITTPAATREFPVNVFSLQ